MPIRVLQPEFSISRTLEASEEAVDDRVAEWELVGGRERDDPGARRVEPAAEMEGSEGGDRDDRKEIDKVVVCLLSVT